MPSDGPAVAAQHGPTTGHLPASSKNVERVGKLDLTNVEGGISDVAAFGNYAYLGTYNGLVRHPRLMPEPRVYGLERMSRSAAK